MTSFTLINMYNNAKKAESTNEEILELISEFIKEGFPKKITIDEISDIADHHFNDIRSILLENKSSSSSIRKLFLKKELQDGLKHLFLIYCKQALGVKIEGNSLTTSQEQALKDLNTDLQPLSKEECDDFYKIFDQYEKEVKKQDSKSVSVFEKIKLFFSNILAKFKSKSLKSFDGKHTGQNQRIVFSKEVFEEDESQEVTFFGDVKERKVSKSPTLETIAEEDDNTTNAIEEAIYNVRNGNEQVSHKEISIPVTPQIAQEEVVLHANRQLVKPLIPKKSQKVIDAGKKIIEGRNQKTDETQTYTSKLEGINLKPANKKPQIAPKPTIKTYSQLEEQPVGNVKGKAKFFESLNSNINPKSKVKGKVERLVEKFESKNQEVTAGRSR